MGTNGGALTNTDRARELYDLPINAEPTRTHSYVSCSVLKGRLGRPDEARELFKKLRRLAHNVLQHGNRGHVSRTARGASVLRAGCSSSASTRIPRKLPLGRHGELWKNTATHSADRPGIFRRLFQVSSLDVSPRCIVIDGPPCHRGRLHIFHWCWRASLMRASQQRGSEVAGRTMTARHAKWYSQALDGIGMRHAEKFSLN